MSKLPLEGISVIDLSHSWAAPHCTRLLADFGAEVIGVEYPGRLGLFRGGSTANGAYNRQPSWFQVNRNKYSVTLDFNADKDREIFLDLIRQADVLVENGRGGVMDRHRFGFGNLAEINRALIMLSMPAYGSTGPDSGHPAYGAALEVMSGIQNLSGYGEGGKPQRIKEIDVINGIGGACAVLTALVHRQRTGEGQNIDFSQLELPTHALLGEHLLEYVMRGKHARALGNRHRRFAPQGAYRCQGEDRWVAVTVQSNAQWGRLCDALGRQELKADPRYATAESRREHHDELDRLLENWTKERTPHEAMTVLQEHAVPAGAVQNAADLAADPHLLERGYFVHGVEGSEKPLMGLPFRLSRTPGKVRWRGPDLGEHNREIVHKRLGHAVDEIRPLKEEELGTAYDPDEKQR